MIASENAWVGQDIAKNRYRIENRLSQTGLACTYLAYDRRLQTRVVVKTPRPELVQRDPKLCDRFTNQVQTLVRLACPHIISVLDFGKHGSLPFVVLQHLEGGSLADWICTQPNRQRQPQPVVRLHKWLLDVASTLDFIHQNKHVHRDVQPATILFDSQQHVFLADFGVVKALSENTADGRMLTTVGQQVIGTPAYMAPELIRGQKVDGGIDQWSLAVTVYEFLSGRMPFAGQMPAQVLASQTQRKPLPLPQIRPDLPKGLWPALQRALSVNPGERYPTCTQFAQAILQTVEDTSRSAAPAGNPPIERTVLQAQPAQPQPVVKPSPQQHVTANVPGPPAGPFTPRQPSQLAAPGNQMAARRNRAQARATNWVVLMVAIAASVIITATLLCVIGKTQKPAFLAGIVTPSSKTEGSESQRVSKAKADARRYQRLLQEERDRADKQLRDRQNQIANLKSDVASEKSRYTRADQQAKSYKAVVTVQNKTKYNVVFETRFRMWDGTYTAWKRYSDKVNDKSYVYHANGAIGAQLRVDYTVDNGKIDWRTYTLRCEMVPSYYDVKTLKARNRYYINTYTSGTKTYIKLVHLSPSS